MKLASIIFFWSLFQCAVLALRPFNKVWENTDVVRTIDLGKSFVKEKIVCNVKNINTEPSNQYIFALPKDFKSDVSLMIAIYEGKNGKKALLQPKSIPIKDDDVAYYEIKFPYPIAPGSNFEFFISSIITNQMVPYPEHIAMEADQVLKVSTNAYFISPYDTLSYVLNLVKANELVELNFDNLPMQLDKVDNNNAVSYKANDTVDPNSLSIVDFTFVKNVPLPYVNFLQRDLWISHWSNKLQLEEYYEVTNHAAKLNKGFSRAKYLTLGLVQNLHHAITALRIPFDKTKKIEENSIYYVDKVGNVSTSQYYDNELIIRPRFPIFGGWNYNFTIGWDYKLDQFLKQDGEEYILAATILDGIYDTTYDNVSFSIYLPEGAEFIDFALPFGTDEPIITHEHSYLDVGKGHLKVTFHFENLIDEMKNLMIILRYRYTTYSMFEKPIQAAVYIFLALMGLYVLKKIDLSIKPTNVNEKVEKDVIEIYEDEE